MKTYTNIPYPILNMELQKYGYDITPQAMVIDESFLFLIMAVFETGHSLAISYKDLEDRVLEYSFKPMVRGFCLCDKYCSLFSTDPGNIYGLKLTISTVIDIVRAKKIKEFSIKKIYIVKNFILPALPKKITKEEFEEIGKVAEKIKRGDRSDDDSDSDESVD